MEISFSEDRMPGDGVVNHMREAGELCVREEGLDPDRVAVSVTFVDSEEIKELNTLYRDKPTITDVLSFPQYLNLDEMPTLGPILLGDVVICSEQALIQADEFGHSPERELVYLFVHSMYHLLGYDHMTEAEKRKMRKKEELIMTQVGIVR